MKIDDYRPHMAGPVSRREKDAPSEPRVEYVQLGTLRLRISRQGEGQPLLLLGGLGNNLSVWRNLVDTFSDFQTIAVDAPGTGLSTTPLLPLSMAALARLYADLIRALELPQVTVIGLSFGGAVAQQLAHQSPELLSGLVLCGTGPGVGGFPGSAYALLELASPMRYYNAVRSQLVAPALYGGRFAGKSTSFREELKERLSLPPSVYGYYCQLAALFGWTSVPWLSSVDVPTLVIAGDADPVYPLVNAHLLERLIPNCTLEVLPGAGHLFVMDSADRVAPVVQRFIAERDSESPCG